MRIQWQRLLVAFLLTAVPTSVSASAFVIENVTVISMTGEDPVAGQSVFVEDGRIADIVPTGSKNFPNETQRIEGQGRYLIPGLADMHVHLSGHNDPWKPEQQLRHLLAYGVTLARGMVGRPEHVDLRDRIAAGDLMGPTIVAASPIFIARAPHPGAPIQAARTVEEATKGVEAAAEVGYDQIKVHEGLAPEVYEAIAKATKKHNLPLVGHVTPSISIDLAFEHGQQIEHLDGYLAAAQKEDAAYKGPVGQFPPEPALDSIDPDKVAALVERTVSTNTWNAPTMALFSSILDPKRMGEELPARDAVRLVPDDILTQWEKTRDGILAQPQSPGFLEKFIAIRHSLLRDLYREGAKLLAGSDSPQFFMVHGDALHLELREFVAAGLPPEAALAAATRNPAEFLGLLEDRGTIEVGKRADLVLLDENPLQNIEATQKIRGVMVHGHWLDRDSLDEFLR